MSKPMTKQRLLNYIPLRMEICDQMERIERMKNDEKIPAMRESDGSKHTGGASDRMANAIIRRMDYEKKIAPQIEAVMSEMELIEAAIDSVSDPMERRVLRLRYIDGEYARHMPWNAIAKRLYGDDDDKNLLATYRLHGRALQSIRKIGVDNENDEVDM